MPGTPRYCSRDCKAEAQRRQKPVDREWLYQKYVVEGLGAPEIAQIVGRDEKRVWEWLKGYKIPTRSRGGASSSGSFKKGQPSAFLGRRGLRGADAPNWKGGITPERQAFYANDEWKASVRAVWQRDNDICQRCKLDFRTVDRSQVTFEIHHIVSFAVKELRCELSNLVLLCEGCHDWIHSRANVNKEFLQ